MKKIVNLLLLLLFLTGCKKYLYYTDERSLININKKSFVYTQESILLVSDLASNILSYPIIPGSVNVRSTYSKHDTNCIIYKEGFDYTIDYNLGKIYRTLMSRMPDYSKYSFFGINDFNHNIYTNYSNNSYFVWIDYRSYNKYIFEKENNQKNLSIFYKKLLSGKDLNIVSYGNSITAGAEASKNEYRFQLRWIKYLNTFFPRSKINFKDVSIPGYNSSDGILFWDSYLGLTNPDLVLLGFGMNDANLGALTPKQYKNNLITLANMIRDLKHAEVIIYSAFRPNDNWHYSSHTMDQFANAAKEAANEVNCTYVDVFNTFEKVFKRKGQSSILANNINHPNNYGHYLYFEAFKSIKF